MSSYSFTRCVNLIKIFVPYIQLCANYEIEFFKQTITPLQEIDIISIVKKNDTFM